ncbi:phosphotransferase [Microbacterium trichothecenolyticum]|uniref:Phosphotransferase n=1 Tax=Microbacterium ureisolvens TaxID=2781186 RepID=A0ABS7I2T5_9MICO|nr:MULTISPECIES: phosphotransferase [Microbacterium]MBW9111982.1 phosphotransferase [Microbacterium ureisolvens]MBW9122409.1 phosphotransferase [Microbacterium trichothecenolyticum]
MLSLVPDQTLTPPAPTMASPQWWGADSIRSRARDVTSGDSVFVKIYTPTAAGYIAVGSSVRATRSAGEAGLGPALLDAQQAEGRLVLADLTDTHKTGTLADFLDTGALERLVAVRRAVWDLPTGEVRRASVFDDVRSLDARLRAVQATLPSDYAWMRRLVTAAERRIALHTDAVLIHGDANCSNTAVAHGNGEILLLDFDWAAVTDPVQDVGSVLLEHAFGRLDARQVFELAWGSFDEALYARARCYAAAEALRGGLIGAWVDSQDPGTLEYSKFSDWMFLRARVLLGDPAFDDHLRRLS